MRQLLLLSLAGLLAAGCGKSTSGSSSTSGSHSSSSGSHSSSTSGSSSGHTGSSSSTTSGSSGTSGSTSSGSASTSSGSSSGTSASTASGSTGASTTASSSSSSTSAGSTSAGSTASSASTSSGSTGAGSTSGSTGATSTSGSSSGSTGGCASASDCPGNDGPCEHRTCDNGVCGVGFVDAGLPADIQTPGDCRVVICDGQGSGNITADDSDLPDDGDPCTTDLCSSGIPSHGFAIPGTTCTANGGAVCDGLGACVQCLQTSDCPGQDHDCASRSCDNHLCQVLVRAAGTHANTQVPGDCLDSQCDGDGGYLAVPNDSDLPDDLNPCTTDLCTSGVPSHGFAVTGTSCTDGGGVCNATGTCVGCNSAQDCPGLDGDCRFRTCLLNTCGFANADAGVSLAAQFPGDCQQLVCDGDGGALSVANDADLPDDGNPCTTDGCSGGAPTHLALDAGSSCAGADGGGLLCNASAQCVGCLVASDCPGSDTECQQRLCSVDGVCSLLYTDAGTLLSQQTAGDCRLAVCDGQGSPGASADDTDKPDAGNACLVGLCASGTASIGFANAGTACATPDGGVVCDGQGKCVQCVNYTDCPGQDTDCQVRVCNDDNTCGFEYAPFGTTTTQQVPGDCQRQVCAGDGGTALAVDDTDKPDAGSACLAGTCSGGVPGSAALDAGTPCSSGGTVCDGTGLCVGCLQPSDCPGSDTECRTRTCTSNVCGAIFADAGTVLSQQTAGDCQTAVCDSAGNIVGQPDDTDLPVDGKECTSDVCNNGVASNPPLAAHTACTQNGGAVCSGTGQCVGCVSPADCAGGGACVAGACQPVSCTDSVKNGGETDVDCGGATTCPRCASGKACLADSDCATGSCLGGACAVTHLVISEIRSRGTGGGNDDFVELYNPTSAAVTFDNTWTLSARSDAIPSSYGTRWTGSATKSIPAHGHFLIGGTAYTQTPARDDALLSGITDATSLVLKKGTTVIDAVCYCPTGSCSVFTAPGSTYICEGTPATNPHDNTTSTNTDKSIERKPGGASGNGQDTDVNANDFVVSAPANPQSSTSTAVP